MYLDTSCIFCAISAGQAPASILYQDDDIMAFMDIQPVNPGHLLVIPRRHATDLAELDEQIGARCFTVAQRLAASLRQSGVRCEGINLFLADGVAAGQEVFHVHLHVIPRFAGDGFHLVINYPASPDRAGLDDLAARIRQAVPPVGEEHQL
jgi:histidine triad (HIT) family protein